MWRGHSCPRPHTEHRESFPRAGCGNSACPVLKREQDDDPIWHSPLYFADASDIYWYRRFYTETLTGQLMVLRTDEPTLYHFERPKVRDTAKDVAIVTLIKALTSSLDRRFPVGRHRIPMDKRNHARDCHLAAARFVVTVLGYTEGRPRRLTQMRTYVVTVQKEPFSFLLKPLDIGPTILRDVRQ
jgi:hypothetical protein